MAETIKIFSFNILETGTVTVTGSPDTGYPEARLWDRSANLYWKVTTGDTYEIGPMGGDTYEIGGMGGDTHEIGPMGDGATQDIYVEVQQSASPRNVGLLYVAGHNFDGLSCEWQYSNDGSVWTDAVADWVQGTTEPIVKTISSAVMAGFWRFAVHGATDPTASEVWMGAGFGFDVQRRPDPYHGYEDNVLWSRSIGGQVRGIKLGNFKERRDYTIRISNGDLGNINTIVADLNHFSKPMLVKDKDGDYFIMHFDPVPGKDFFNNSYTQLNIGLMET